MAWRPWICLRTVGTHLLGGIFDAIHEGGHQSVGHCCAGQQSGPVTTAFVSTQLQTNRQGRTEILCIVVNTCFEVRQQLRILLAVLIVYAEHGLVALDEHTSYKQGNAYECHVVHELIRLHAGIGLRLKEVKIHLRWSLGCLHVQCQHISCRNAYQLCLHLGDFQLQWLCCREITCGRKTAHSAD